MSRRLRAWAPIAGAVLTLGVLVWRLGSGPFLDGLRSVDGGALAAGAGIAVVTTACYGWRWKIVARGLGVDLSLRTAVAAYYRSVFLNVTLPGGILGDVHRGVSHGRDVSDVGLAMRAVVWERFAGQIVQVLIAVIVLLALPSPVRSFMPLVAIAVIAALVGVVLLARRWSDGAALLARSAWPGIALTSVLVVGGHAATFLIATRTAGTTAPASRVLPLALLVIEAMALPNIAGWGPREGVAAWVFGAAGLGAGRGVATAVVYGVMTLVASLPGAVVLVVAWFRGTRGPGRSRSQLRNRPARA
jgi:glycosyltransferase 2 family protein